MKLFRGVRFRARGVSLIAFFMAAISFPVGSSGADLAPNESHEEAPLDETAAVLKDMGVVQKKAMQKEGKLLVSSFFGLELSDSPITMHSINFNLGYAISDFWEVHLNFAPIFLVDERPIVDKIKSLELADGNTATITSSVPSMQYGAELVWAFGYGKDSFGLHSLVRSDTFVKLGAGVIQYEIDTGMRFNVGVGKTYFITRWLGLRLAAGANYMETIIENVKAYSLLAQVEGGLVFYIDL